MQSFEYRAPGVLSDIPYNVRWDDSDRAHEILGWFWIYASDDSVEAA